METTRVLINLLQCIWNRLSETTAGLELAVCLSTVYGIDLIQALIFRINIFKFINLNNYYRFYFIWHYRGDISEEYLIYTQIIYFYNTCIAARNIICFWKTIYILKYDLCVDTKWSITFVFLRKLKLFAIKKNLHKLSFSKQCSVNDQRLTIKTVAAVTIALRNWSTPMNFEKFTKI